MAHAKKSANIRNSVFRKWSMAFLFFLFSTLLVSTGFAESISGKVSNSTGSPISGIAVYAYDPATNNQIILATSGADGSYIISDPILIKAGDYKIYFYAGGTAGGYTSQFYSNKPSLFYADIVTVITGTVTTGINATLLRAGSISGTVTNSTGVGILGVSVGAYDATSGSEIITATSGSGGIYTMNLPEGTYKLLFSDNHFGYVSQWYSNKSSQAFADTVSVTAGNITTVNAVMSKTPPVALNVTVDGNGTVNIDPPGINCTSGVCTQTYDSGVVVKLMALETDSNFTFAGWTGTGACTGSTSVCNVTMDSDKDITATFTAKPATVKIDGDTVPYYTIGSALDAITTEGNTVRARDVIFVENVIMASPVSIMLMGGFTDSAFSLRTGTSTTVIDGSLKIGKGTLRVERLIVR